MLGHRQYKKWFILEEKTKTVSHLELKLKWVMAQAGCLELLEELMCLVGCE